MLGLLQQVAALRPGAQVVQICIRRLASMRRLRALLEESLPLLHGSIRFEEHGPERGRVVSTLRPAVRSENKSVQNDTAAQILEVNEVALHGPEPRK